MLRLPLPLRSTRSMCLVTAADRWTRRRLSCLTTSLSARPRLNNNDRVMLHQEESLVLFLRNEEESLATLDYVWSKSVDVDLRDTEK